MGGAASDGVSIRRYREGDGPAIVRGFERIFGQPRTLEEWAWKLPRQDRERTVMVAERNREVLAHFAAIPVRLQVDGRRVQAGQVVDVYSTRRQGLFVRLVDRYYEELCGPGRLELVYGFPGTRHFALGVQRLRYSEPEPVPFHVRSVRREERHRRRISWLSWAPWRSAPSVREGVDPAAAEWLWQRSAVRYPVTAVRDRGWIERRFTGRPGVEYRHLAAWHRGRPAALAVVRVMEDVTDRVAHWAELVWDGESPRTLAALDAAVGELADREGASEARLWLGGDPEAEAVLAERGWRRAPEPKGLHLGAVSFLPDLDAAEVCRRLVVTMGDADLV